MKRKKISLAGLTVIAAAALGFGIYWNLPDTKVGRELKKANEYMLNMQYVQAEEAYTEALSIDETSVKAYRGLAEDYLAQGMEEQAEQILKQGYETTGEEVLLQNYCATILNDVVADINEGTADMSSISHCLNALEEDPENQQALSLLETCYERVLCRTDEAGSNTLMLDTLEGEASFQEYEDVMNRLFALEKESGSLKVAELAGKYAVIDASKVYLSLSHKEAYRNILTQALPLGTCPEAGELLSCLDKEECVSAYFSPVFTLFETKDYEAVKEILASEEFTVIRDAFVSGTMDFWRGDSYIPVTKEAIVFTKEKSGWKFGYVEDFSKAKPTGAIRILGIKMEDLGVQRSSIEYVPAFDPQNYYPHIEYEIVYWNTMVSGIATDNNSAVARMNYRFAEKTYTETGVENDIIYDWGGPNEKRQHE